MSTSVPSPQSKKEVHVLKKRPGQSGRTEVHCLEGIDGQSDTCILVNVPSRSTLVSELSTSPTESDESFKAYAHKANYETKRSYENDVKKRDSIEVRRSSGYDKYAKIFEDDSEYDVEQLWMENEIEAEESSKPLVDCNQFLRPVSFVKEMVNQICQDGEAKADLIWPSLIGTSMEKGEVTDEDEYNNLYEDNDEDDDKDNNNYHDGGFFPAYNESIEYAVIESKESITNWPTIGEFNVELGALKIDEYLSSFETEENWMYVIYYKGQADDQCSELHKYQAIYSLPTWKYPVAQVTASIFFTIEVCKALFPYCFVDVTFQYETFRQIYSVGTSELHEQWLHYILDSKIKFFQTITY